ncbi:MAG TPA: DUF2905 domain-containing protein [Armatimonadota bacterium]|nr:DUF2905 domain-containing protein [Armatimonadota bacterium]
MDLSTLGRVLLVIGILLAVVGLLAMFLGKLGLGRLPGDILIKRDGTTIYVPIVTMLLLSVILSLLLNFILWLFRGR